MKDESSQVNQPWVTCHLTDILITYIKETKGTGSIDWPSLFRGVDGIEIPADPERFLTNVHNWVPLSVLRELEMTSETISGAKDVAYHAAKAYFEPGKKPLSSIFEIIVRVLNDVRSALISANLWGLAQSNYLKLQAFEKQAATPEHYMLAQFGPSGRATVGSINMLRGMLEGFPRLYPFIGKVECHEEISQLRIEDIVKEFPDFTGVSEGNRLFIQRRSSRQPIVEAAQIPIGSEAIPQAKEFLINLPETLIAAPEEGKIRVLTHLEETDSQRTRQAVRAYKIVKPGKIRHGPLSYSFGQDNIYNAPYSRLRLIWEEKRKPDKEISIDNVRQEVSRLLFEHLRQIKQAQTRVIQDNIEKRRLTLENIRLRREIEREHSFAGIVGQSDKIKDLLSLVKSAAETDVTVLVQGETGTGKELIARAIHYSSPRRGKRFIAINCGALSETLLESELFGHEKGAFTGATNQRKGIFESADGGTLFLDEIGEITPGTQVKLLRVLQEGELQRVGGSETLKVDVRIVAATNQNLADLMSRGRVRQDLFYRLDVFPITVPPLRDRVEDIPLLVKHFVEKGKEKLHRQISGVSPEAMAVLMAYPWPGNIRELENVIQRTMVIAKGDILQAEEFPPDLRGTEAKAQPKDLKGITRESAEMIEKRTIQDALSKTDGNVTRAAKALGISRATLQNKMKAYGLRESKN